MVLFTTPEGLLFYMYFKRDTEIAGAVTGSKKPVTLKLAHDMLGHSDENKTRKAAKAIGLELKPGNLLQCEACAAGKAKTEKCAQGK